MYGVVIVEGRMTVELDSGTEINYFKFYNKGIEVTTPRGQKLKLNFLDDKDCDEPPKNLDVMIVCECQCQGRETRSRIRCYSEVTSTPYSSHENLIPDPDIARTSVSPQSQHSPTSAEAPELSSIGEVGEDLPLGVNIQRRNSAPEISEPLPFVDESSMEL